MSATRSERLWGNDGVGYTPSRNGQFFLGVSTTTQQLLVYDIQVYAGARPSLAYFDFSARTVSTQQLDSGNLRVSVPSATVQSTVAALNATMQYVVYWAPYPADQSNFATACGCNLVAAAPATSQSGAAVMTVSSDGRSVSSEISGLPSNSQYKVNVVARVVQLANANDPLAPAAYEQVANTNPTIAARFATGGGGVDSGTMAAIAIPVVLTVVLAFAYLVYRNRQLKRELTGVEMADVPRTQVIKAAAGGGFRARATAKLNQVANTKPTGRTRYSQLLGMGGGASEEAGGRELSTNELGLDDDEDVEVGLDDGVYANGGDAGAAGQRHAEEDEQKYTLDLEHEENNRDDILGLRV